MFKNLSHTLPKKKSPASAGLKSSLKCKWLLTGHGYPVPVGFT